MSEKEKEGKKSKVVIEHKNIFAALAAFQAENPTIKRTKEFGKEGDKMHWWYSPLDEVLQVVRPLTARHGLAFTWEGVADGGMVCALYHATYTRSRDSETDFIESNVLRSMPVKVKREGDMKDVGSNSTYARRITLSEVLGIAPDEDKDATDMGQRGPQMEKVIFTRSKESIKKAKTIEEVDKAAAIFEKDLKALEEKKVPSLGLIEDQYHELLIMAGLRKEEINNEHAKQV